MSEHDQQFIALMAAWLFGFVIYEFVMRVRDLRGQASLQGTGVFWPIMVPALLLVIVALPICTLLDRLAHKMAGK